jgi:hypothetical protein
MSVTSSYLLLRHGGSYEARNWTLAYILLMTILATMSYIGNAMFWAAKFTGVDMPSLSHDSITHLVSGCAMLEYLVSDLALVSGDSDARVGAYLMPISSSEFGKPGIRDSSSSCFQRYRISSQWV